MNPKSEPVKSNSEQYQFSFKYISSKNQQQNFKIKKNPYFGVNFAQKEFFLNTPVMYNCRGHPGSKCQICKADWSLNQKLFRHYQQAKIVQSICSIRQIICEITWFNSHMIYKASPIQFWSTVDLRVPNPKRPCPFLTTTTT